MYVKARMEAMCDAIAGKMSERSCSTTKEAVDAAMEHWKPTMRAELAEEVLSLFGRRAAAGSEDGTPPLERLLSPREEQVLNHHIALAVMDGFILHPGNPVVQMRSVEHFWAWMVERTDEILHGRRNPSCPAT
eukprot:TRINITY_DN8821_c0_g1_i2.p2 TRINITY_DN8821_c0_g1~~TRINITY_DN8821_c0_g1_i2.p2  ORF type:complete len:133 (-),score=5.56 TRINITY_DN8821_c0_g1_i2:483-881(-)